MNLVQMSLTAGILILGITVFRTLFIHRVPKKVMVLLWEIAILRLVLPVAIPLPFPGIGDLGAVTLSLERHWIVEGVMDTASQTGGRETAREPGAAEAESENVVVFSGVEVIGRESCFLWIIYGAAALGLALGSIYLYFRDSQLFREGLPMSEEERRRLLLMLDEKDRRRMSKVKLRVCDRTASPVTYGVLRPAIVFPKGSLQNPEKEISFWLHHELVHLRHHDNLKKLIAHGVLCLHWFNPLVWLMYLLFNRDMELLCDETVVRGRRESRRDYALALLSMAQQKSLGFQTGLGFGRNAVTERITAVMKIKQTTLRGILGAGAALVIALTVFGSHYVSYAADRNDKAKALETVELAEYTVTADVQEKDGSLFQGFYGLWEELTNPWVSVTVAEHTGYKESDTVQEQELSYEVMSAQIAVETGRGDADTADAAENTEYVTVTASPSAEAEEGGGIVEEGGQMSEDTMKSIEAAIGEYQEFGLTIKTGKGDYQLYFGDEPVCFFADNTIPEEEGFSGRLFMRPASGRNGKTGVITLRDSNGVITGLKHLTQEETEAYTGIWR